MTTSRAEHRSIALVQQAIDDIRRGKMVILTDDEDRENEGDLVMAAEKVTPEAVNFMAKEGRGLICLSLAEAQIKQLNLPLMVTDNTSSFQTAFTVSIEAAHGVTTGISAADRALTIRTAIRADARPADLARPGHVFPLRARNGGVLVRPGQTEGSVDLSRLAGLHPSGVICEIMNDDGTMSRRPQLERFAKKHKLTLVSVADLINYRLTRERVVRRVGQTTVERPGVGTLTAYAYTTDVDPTVHLALVKGDLSGKAPVLTRVHRATPLGEALDAATGTGNLKLAFERIAQEGRGVVVLLQKVSTGTDVLALTPPSNEQAVPGAGGQTRLKEFGIGAQILKDLGVSRLKLLTNTANTIIGVEHYGLTVTEQIRLSAEAPAPAKRARKH
jgi:3,4-dihydroxy 2-butanone 4-phosphate synthase/GTP cyclohydrolase II